MSAGIPKKCLTVAVLGEKDHGKSTLLGRLLAEAGATPADRVAEIKGATKKSGRRFEWAHVLDSFRYEREMGMTLDTTRAVTEIGGTRYEFIDVPGHRQLTKNMLSGASSARYAIFVIAADEGLKPQTLRHAEVARFLGIRHGIVVINKCDRIGYSPGAYENIRRVIADNFAGKGFEELVFLPAVARNGDNLLTKSKRMLWFQGPTLADAIKKYFGHQPETGAREPFLLVVQDVYHGPVIVGKIHAGRIAVDDEVLLLSSRRRRKVSRLLVGHREVRRAEVGDSIGLVLVPGPRHVKRGDIITMGGTARVRTIVAECVFAQKPNSGVMRIESGFCQSSAKVSLRGKIVIGQPMAASIYLEQALPVFDTFILKDRDEIIGVGRVASLSQAGRIYDK